jgi:hypothetical protein
VKKYKILFCALTALALSNQLCAMEESNTNSHKENDTIEREAIKSIKIAYLSGLIIPNTDKDKKGLTLLAKAVKNLYLNMVYFLLKEIKVNPNVVCDDGKTALDVLESNDQYIKELSEGIKQVLLEHGAKNAPESFLRQNELTE